MITWFKELWQLIKMLFTKIKEENEVDIIVMKNFPFSGYRAMMWCGNIITRHDALEISSMTKRHELIHVKQARLKKTWIGFYLKYVWEWIKGNPILHPASSAYYTIPYEVEAYANQHKLRYEPTKETIKKYTLKHRKKTYREHREYWKDWIKTL